MTAAPERMYALGTTPDWHEPSVTLVQDRASAGVGATYGALTGSSWRACVYAQAHIAFFDECGTPRNVVVDVPETGATGHISFDLDQEIFDGVAHVDLRFTDDGQPPLPGYTVSPYLGGTGGDVFLTTGLTWHAAVTGSIRIRMQWGGRRRHGTVSVRHGTPMTVSDLVAASAYAYLP